MDLEKLLSTSEVAEKLGIDAATVRRYARKDMVPGCTKVLGQYGFNWDIVKDWEPPEGRGVRASRTSEDGTPVYRWKVWATKEQIEELREEGFEVENPRKIARKRRAKRKAEEGDEEDSPQEPEELEENPFAGFGA